MHDLAMGTCTGARRMYRTVIILGAAGSGTRMLRDTLTKLDGLGTWPCDEINYIWRHGNLRHGSDELSPEHATPKVRQFIRDQFDRFAGQHGLDFLVEKTCANTLRVGFVDRVVPDALYVHLVRDGRDAALSCAKQWKSNLSLQSLNAKIWYAPLIDVPYHVCRLVHASAYRLLSREERHAYWGPHFEGMGAALRQKSIAEVAALQWRRSVDLTTAALERVPADRVFTLHFEDFAANPAFLLRQLAQFINVPLTSAAAIDMTTHIDTRSVARAVDELGGPMLSSIESLIADTLKATGYKLRCTAPLVNPRATDEGVLRQAG